MKYNKIVLFVLDGCGIGSQEDYTSFHPIETNTLGNVYAALPGFRLHFMESLGLNDLLNNSGYYHANKCYGKMREKTAGNDTFAGLWEMFGVVFNKRFISNSKSLSPRLIQDIKLNTKVSTICNDYVSGFIALDKYYNEHKKTRSPILYLSDDGVVLLAAHKDVMPVNDLNKTAREIREVLFNQGYVRIITRPFYGKKGNFIRDESSRMDFLLVDVPQNNLIQKLVKRGVRIRMTQHLARIFNYPEGVFVLKSKYNKNSELFPLIEMDTNNNDFELQLYVIPDTDNLGHKKNIKGFGNALLEFDVWLKSYCECLKENELVIITADHGCDPTKDLRGHCREFVPLLIYAKNLPFHGGLGERSSFSDIGQTIADNFKEKSVNIGSRLEVL